MKLFLIFYIDKTYGDPPAYEAITDDFTLWLEDHNKRREEDGNEPEWAWDFEVTEIKPKLYKKQQ